jgi:hypothetical protein
LWHLLFLPGSSAGNQAQQARATTNSHAAIRSPASNNSFRTYPAATTHNLL